MAHWQWERLTLYFAPVHHNRRQGSIGPNTTLQKLEAILRLISDDKLDGHRTIDVLFHESIYRHMLKSIISEKGIWLRVIV